MERSSVQLELIRWMVLFAVCTAFMVVCLVAALPSHFARLKQGITLAAKVTTPNNATTTATTATQT